MRTLEKISNILNKIYLKILKSNYITLESNEIRHYMENGDKTYSRFTPTLSVSLIIDDYFKSTKFYSKPIINGIIVTDNESYIDITIHTNKVGLLIGKQGSTYDELKNKIKTLFNKDVELNLKSSPTPFGLDYIEYIT